MIMTNQPFFVHITKYALTKGILVKKAKLCLDTSKEMVEIIDSRMEYYHRGEWHMNRMSAVKRAEEMKKRKILSLTKQLKRIHSLHF